METEFILRFKRVCRLETAELLVLFGMLVLIVPMAFGQAPPNSISENRFEHIGPEGGTVISLAAGPGTILYLGTADGHIFASLDAGTHWELRGRIGTRYDGVVQHLLVDVEHSERMFAAIWFQDPGAGGGVFRSEDAGKTWTTAGLAGEAVRALEQSSSNPNVFVAGARSGVFRSEDGGKIWQRISPAGDLEIRNLDSAAIDPRDERIIYAGTYHLPWKTVDGGKNWTPVAAGMIDDSDVMSLRIDAQTPARIFASTCSGIYRSESGGGQWIKLQGIPYDARRTQMIVQDGSDSGSLFAGTTEGLWTTRDAGENWVRISPREWTINAAVIVRTSREKRRIVIGTEDRGVLVSDDGGVNFLEANSGFSHRIAADIASDPDNASHLLVRFTGQKEMLLESADGGKTWGPLSGGVPAGGLRKLYAFGGSWWAALESGGLARYDRESDQWREIDFHPPLVRPAKSVSQKRPHGSQTISTDAVKNRNAAPLVNDISCRNSDVYVATSEGLWKGSLQGTYLRRLTSTSVSRGVRRVTTSRKGDEIFALAASNILRSIDDGKMWEQIVPPDGVRELYWLALRDHTDSTGSISQGQSLWVGTANGVFVLHLSGDQKWTRLQSGLPAAESEQVSFLEGGAVIAMRVGGVYLSTDDGTTWRRLDMQGQVGLVGGASVDGTGGLVIASRNEGLLRLPPQANR